MATEFFNKKLIIPGVFGNLLEWYDFALYGYFAPLIAHLFFPMHSIAGSLLMTFGVFAVGFLMRPFGAILFGYFGDRFGRKKALSAGIILMAAPTTIMGLLPTYQHIGVWAAILLTSCRLLQGLAIGGEFGGSIIYITEHAPSNRRGLYGSWAMFSAFMGLLLGSATSTAMSAIFSTDALQTWGWRLPFLAGFLLGAVGLYLRFRMPETPYFLVELMPTPIRYTAMSLPYNLANTLFGGTAPLAATFLIEKTGNVLSPSFYLIFAGGVMLIAVLILNESYRKNLD